MTEIAVAEARAIAAKARLHATLETLQERLQPRSLAKTAAESGRDVLAAGADHARANPARAVGLAALLTAVLARHRIAGLLRRRRHDPAETTSPAKHSSRTKEDPTQ